LVRARDWRFEHLDITPSSRRPIQSGAEPRSPKTVLRSPFQIRFDRGVIFVLKIKGENVSDCPPIPHRHLCLPAG
jgi:hypothetical protein